MKDHVMPTQLVGSVPAHHTITWMIFLCTLACYLERQGFSIAFTELAHQAELNEEVKGHVLSGFFYGYAVMQIPGGWLAARHGGSRVLALSFALWGLISLVMPGTIAGGGTTVIMVCRVAIGASQGLFIPASHTLLAQWIPVHERSRLVSLAMSGMYLGSAVAMLVFPYVVEHFGPVAEFRCAGLIAIAWLVLWSRVGFDLHDGASVGDGRDQTSSKESDDIVAGGKLGSAGGWATDDEDTSSLIPKQDDNKLALIHARSASLILRSPSPPLETRISVASSNAVAVGGVGSGAASSASIPWGVMASSPAVWAILTSNFAFHYATYVLMNWLPTYYQKHLNLSLNNMGNLFKVTPYVMMFLASNAGGSLGTWAHVSLGMTIAFSRKLVNSVGFAVAIISLTLMPRARHLREGVLYTTMALSSLGFCRGGWAVNHMDIAPRHAGVVMAIANGAGTLAGVIGVQLTGRILDAMGGPEEAVAWSWVLGVVAAVCLMALVIFIELARGDVLFH